MQMNKASASKQFRETLECEAAVYGVTLEDSALERLSRYYELLTAWNSRVQLVAPCTPREFATRHILESLVLVKYLPLEARVAEVGAGAGLPILPCLVVRPDLRAVLIEASQKKAIFLREALNLTATGQATVIPERFENIPAPAVDFITCRALERFEAMLPHLLRWAPAHTSLFLFGGKRLAPRIEALGFTSSAEILPQSKARFLFRVDKP